ncbi:MAG: replicative DNA helicase [Armatimonadota bacterium]
MIARTMPFDADAEKAVLGAMLLEKEAMAKAADLLTPQQFYSGQHQVLFEVLRDLQRRGEPPDPVVVKDALKRADQLEQVGGEQYLSELQTSAPTAAAIEHYVSIVQRCAQQRWLIQAARELESRAFQDGAAPEALCSDTAEELYRIAALKQGDFERFPEMGARLIQQIEQQMNADGNVLGIRTGLSKLDDHVYGWCPGTSYVIASRPSAGKTAFCLQQCCQAAEQGKRVLFFSLEMTTESLGRRYLARQLPRDLADVMRAKFRVQDMEQIVDAFARTQDWRFWFSRRSDLTISQLRAEARNLAARHGGLDLIAVDYLQLLLPDRPGSRNEELTQISHGVKALATELDCATLSLSQLSRDCEKERRRPQLSDLRDSGSIEQDADAVIFLHRPFWDPEYPETQREIIIAKQRNGGLGRFDLYWSGEYQRFENQEIDWNGD